MTQCEQYTTEVRVFYIAGYGCRWESVTDERSVRRIRQEARSFQEEVEASVAELAASDRTLRDVLVDYGKQGFELRVEVTGHYLVGRIEHVGKTVLRLVLSEGRKVDMVINHIVGIRRVGSEVLAGEVTTGHPASMIARLREAVQTQELVHVERVSGEAIDGRVVAVLDTAVEIVSGRTQSNSVRSAGAGHSGADVQWLVPIDAIVWMWRL